MEDDDKASSGKQLRRRGIYLLPNLFTTANLFAGFYSIIATMKGLRDPALYDTAAIAIFIALIADGFDGRVARLTNTQTEFGEFYDSLADMVSFGVAPACLTYGWALYGLGKVGWLVAFLFAAATALRLARFNTQVSVQDKRYFQGFPCPAAAAVVAGFVWCSQEYRVAGSSMMFVTLALTVGLAFCMVSNVRYHSFKQLDLKGKVPFVTILVMVLLFACIAIDPAQVLFIIFLSYALSGPLLTFGRSHAQRLRRRHARKRRKKKKAADANDAEDEAS